MGVHERTLELEQDERLDAAVERIDGLLPGALREGPVHDQLAGRWLGHALHPLMTDVPLGTFMSATMLDLLAPEGSKAASELLKTVGILSAIPTTLTGLAEYQHADHQRRRVATVHASMNTVALGAYVGSLACSRRDRRRAATALAVVGGVFAAAGGYLGGHLSFARGVGMDPDGHRR